MHRDGDGASSALSDDVELLASLGVMPVLDAWRSKLTAYLAAYAAWLDEAKEYYLSNSGKLIVLFNAAQMPVANEVSAQLRRLVAQAGADLRCFPTDMQDFCAFADCVDWIAEFLQVGYYNYGYYSFVSENVKLKSPEK